MEAKGWDGLSVVDSQNLSGDAFVALAMAATVTTRLKLGTGVTNSITRRAATLATAMASVHSVSRGRAVLGIGRGDSALAHVGRAPDRIIDTLQALQKLGLDQFILSGSWRTDTSNEGETAKHLLETEVLPGLRGIKAIRAHQRSHMRW